MYDTETGAYVNNGPDKVVVRTVNWYTAFCFVYVEMTKSAKNN